MSIIIRNLWKSYGKETVFRDFSAEFVSGEVTVLMGKSGCGKTTLMRILLGLEKADRGTVSGVPDKKSAVFQENRLFESFDAVSNIKAVLRGKNSVEEIKENLEAVGLSGSLLKKPVLELSGGMQRRTALVRAMMADGGLVVLDEPFEGLDQETKKRAIEYVKTRRRGRTLLLVTHNREEGEAVGGDFFPL